MKKGTKLEAYAYAGLNRHVSIVADFKMVASGQETMTSVRVNTLPNRRAPGYRPVTSYWEDELSNSAIHGVCLPRIFFLVVVLPVDAGRGGLLWGFHLCCRVF